MRTPTELERPVAGDNMGEFAGGAAVAEDHADPATVRRELLALIDRDLKRHGVDVYNPRPNAPSAPVLLSLIPTTGNVLIPLGEVISRIGMNLRLLKPGL